MRSIRVQIADTKRVFLRFNESCTACDTWREKFRTTKNDVHLSRVDALCRLQPWAIHYALPGIIGRCWKWSTSRKAEAAFCRSRCVVNLRVGSFRFGRVCIDYTGITFDATKLQDCRSWLRVSEDVFLDACVLAASIVQRNIPRQH